MFGGVIGAMSDSRNNVLLGGISSGWNQLLSQGIADSAGFQDAIKEVAKSHGTDLEYMINDQVDFQDALKKTIKDGSIGSNTLGEAISKLAKKTEGLSEEQLDELGYTRQQVDELDKLNESIQNGSVNLDEFVKKMAVNSGRENLIEALRNSLNGLLEILKPIGEGFREIFPAITAEQLYAFTEKLKELTSQFHITDETALNIKNTFKGVFAIFSLVGQALKAIIPAIFPITSGFGKMLGSVLDITGSWGEWLSKVDETAKKTNFFAKAIGGMVSGITNLFDNTKETIGAFLSGFLQDLDKLKEKLNINFDLPGVEIFSSLLQRMHDRMAEVMHSSETLRNAVNDAFNSMVSSAAFTTFSEGLGKIVIFLQSIWKVIKMVGKGITDSVGEFASGFAGALGDTNFDAAFDLVNSGLLSALLAGIVKFMFGLSKVVDKVGESIGTFAEIKNAVLDTFGAFQQQLKANVLLKIAGAIALLTLSLVVLSLIDSAKLTSSLVAITGLFADLMISMKIFSTFSLKSMKELMTLASVMLIMSISVLILAGAMKVLAGLDWDGVGKGLVGVGVLMLLLVKTAEELSKINGKMMKGIAGLIILAITIRILVEAVKDLADMSWEDLAKGLLGVGVLIGELAAFMYAAKFGKMGVSTGLGLLALAIGVRILAESVEVFANMDTSGLIQGLAAIGIILAELAIFMQTSGDPKRMISTSIGLVILGAAMLILAEAVGKFGELPLETMIQGLAGLTAVLTILAISLNLMPKNMLGIGVGLVVVGAALNIMANALQTIGGMSIENLILALGGLAGALAIISVAMYAMEGGLIGAAAMLVMAAALAIFVPTLVLLSTMSMAEIGKGLIALAGAFIVLGVAGAVLGPLLPAILGLAVAFALIGVGIAATGVGLLAIGVGLSAMAAGFGALATLGAAGAVAVVAALVIIIEGVASMIPIVVQKLGEGIIALVQVLIDAIPVIVEALVVLVVAVVAGLVAIIPVLVDGILVLCTSILTAIATYAPIIIEALLNIIVGVLDGITAAIPVIIQAAVDLIIAFIDGIASASVQLVQAAVNAIMTFIAGIASASAQLVQAAFDIMIAFINGLADCLDENTPLLVEAMNKLSTSIVNALLLILTGSVNPVALLASKIGGAIGTGIKNKVEDVKSAMKDLIDKVKATIEETIDDFKDAGKNVIDGFIGGIKAKLKDAIDAATELGSKVVSAAKSAFDINSPSRKFIEIGKSTIEGLVVGIKKYASNAYSTAGEVANNTTDAMRDSFSGISRIVDGNFNLNPVIRPTLDLTEVTNGAKSISSLFNRQRLAVASASTDQNGAYESGSNVNFVQNIYSPKSVSNVDIYRQTKNLVSEYERVITP